MEQLVKEFIAMANRYALYKEYYSSLSAKVDCLYQFWKADNYVSCEDIAKIFGFEKDSKNDPTESEE